MQVQKTYTVVPKLMMQILILELIFVNVLCARTLPTVKPGLFVIHGVHTCGGGDGFCLMGNDCTVNEEFLPDPDGHCAGLRSAFIPESHFSCCKYVPNNATFDEFGTYPPTSTLSDDLNPTDTVSNLSDNFGISSESHAERSNTTEESPQVDDRVSQVKRADTLAEPSPVLDSNSEAIDIAASVDNTLGESNQTETSNSSLQFPATGLIDAVLQPTDDRDSIHSLQLLKQPQESQKPLEFDEIKAQDLEPRGITRSEVDVNHVGCDHDIHTDSNSPAFEHLENFSGRPNESLVGDYVKDFNDHKHERSPAQWFRISRKLGTSRPTEGPLFNFVDQSPVTDVKANESVIVIKVPEELRRTLSTPPEHCRSFPNAEEDVPRCMSVWKFVLNGSILCFGTLINSIWLLTSASCITKIYDEDMEVVMVTDVEENSGLHKISTMIVHENYKIGNQNEMNNVGLISLDSPTDSSCFVCFSNDEEKYSDRSCSTYVLTRSKTNDGSLEKCEDRVRVLNMYSKLYLSLLCPSNDDFRQLVDNSTANILWCEDTFVGIETSYADGLFVFTPAFEHAEWIQKNIQQYL